MMKRIVTLAIALATMVCLRPALTQAGTPAKTPVHDNTPVLIGLTPDTTYAPFFVAIDKGFLKAEGVNAAYRLGQGNQGTLNVMAGAEQMAPNSELPTVINRAKGGNFKCIATTLRAAKQIGAASIATITRPADLYRHSVGVPFGSGGQYFFERYVAYYHLDEAKMHVRNVDAAELLPALAGGDIDAFFSWQPWLSKAATLRKGAHILALSGTNNIYVMRYCLNVGDAFATRHASLVTATLRGVINATTWMNSHPHAAAAVVSRAIRLPVPQVEQLMGEMTYPIELTDTDSNDFLSVAQWLQQQGKIPSNVNTQSLISGLFDPHYLKAIAPQSVTLSEK